MPGFLDQAGDSAERWSAIGAAVGFFVGSAMAAKRTLTLRVMGEIGIVTAYFAAAGAAFGVAFEAVSRLP